jgi:hypothetical protein
VLRTITVREGVFTAVHKQANRATRERRKNAVEMALQAALFYLILLNYLLVLLTP